MAFLPYYTERRLREEYEKAGHSDKFDAAYKKFEEFYLPSYWELGWERINELITDGLWRQLRRLTRKPPANKLHAVLRKITDFLWIT